MCNPRLSQRSNRELSLLTRFPHHTCTLGHTALQVSGMANVVAKSFTVASAFGVLGGGDGGGDDKKEAGDEGEEEEDKVTGSCSLQLSAWLGP